MHEYADQDNPTKAVVLEETDAYFKVGGYGVVFGGRDLEGEYFDADTNFWFDRMGRTPVVLYQHGKDAKTRRDQAHALKAEIDSFTVQVFQIRKPRSQRRRGLRSAFDNHGIR